MCACLCVSETDRQRKDKARRTFFSCFILCLTDFISPSSCFLWCLTEFISPSSCFLYSRLISPCSIWSSYFYFISFLFCKVCSHGVGALVLHCLVSAMMTTDRMVVIMPITTRSNERLLITWFQFPCSWRSPWLHSFPSSTFFTRWPATGTSRLPRIPWIRLGLIE